MDRIDVNGFNKPFLTASCFYIFLIFSRVWEEWRLKDIKMVNFTLLSDVILGVIMDRIYFHFYTLQKKKGLSYGIFVLFLVKISKNKIFN